MNYALTELVLLFFVYGFLGWCTEVAFAAFKSGRFVNRGFLNGPICPIYGFGLIGVVLLLAPLKGNLWLLFVGSCVITTLIELVTGFLLEKLFHAKWWDYSGMPLNIGGYVCLLFSLIWGVACMAIVLWVHPPIYGLVHRLPKLLTNILDGIFLAMLAVDLAATVATIRKLSRRLARITLLADEIHTLSDELGENIAERALAAKQKIETEQAKLEQGVERYEERKEQSRLQREQRLAELRAKVEAALSERGFGHRRLLEAFPNLKSYRNPESLRKLREAIDRIKHWESQDT